MTVILVTVIPFDGDLTAYNGQVRLTTYVKTAEGVDVLAELGMSISIIANRKNNSST